MASEVCGQCPGVGQTSDGRAYPFVATLRCRLDGGTACDSSHASRHNLRMKHRWPKWEKVTAKAKSA